MYHPTDRGKMPLTEDERALRLKAMTKEISRPNTRFHGKTLDVEGAQNDDNVVVFYAPIAGATPVAIRSKDIDKVKKCDLEDLRKTPIDSLQSLRRRQIMDSFVKTHSPAHGFDESPLITKGEIEGTPLRLEVENVSIDIGGSGNEPQFKIRMPPSRDMKAHSLLRKGARKLGERSKVFQRPELPSPVRGGNASTSGRILSPTAQKFMRNAISKSSRSIDKSLRASYRSESPGLSTPKWEKYV